MNRLPKEKYIKSQEDGGCVGGGAKKIFRKGIVSGMERVVQSQMESAVGGDENAPEPFMQERLGNEFRRLEKGEVSRIESKGSR